VSTPSVGYPDNQLLSIWRGTPLGQGTFTVTTVASLVVQGWVTNFASLALFANLQNGVGVTIRTQFYTDDTLAVALQTYVHVLSTVGVGVDVVLPAMGDYVVVTIFTGQAGNNPVIYSIEPTNTPVTKPTYQGSPNSIDALAASIGAGVSQVIQLPYVMEGNGQLFVQCGNAGTSFNMEADSILESGALSSNLARSTAITGSGNLTFLAPSSPVQMTIKNNGAAAEPFSWHCQVLSQ
jgi:hypothetical protein